MACGEASKGYAKQWGRMVTHMALTNLGRTHCSVCYATTTATGVFFDGRSRKYYCQAHFPLSTTGALNGLSGFTHQHVPNGAAQAAYVGGAQSLGSQGLGQAGTNSFTSSTSGFLTLANVRAAYPHKDDDHSQIKRTPVRFGEIRAYRAWYYGNGHLMSVSAGRCWAPHHPMEALPGWRDSDMGIHSFRDMGRALDFCGAQDAVRLPLIYGAVEIWGEIIEFELGYQSEFAQIVEVSGYAGRQTAAGDAGLKDLKEKYDEKDDAGPIPISIEAVLKAQQIRRQEGGG